MRPRAQVLLQISLSDCSWSIPPPSHSMSTDTTPETPHFTSLSSHALRTRDDFALACTSLLTPLLPFFSPAYTRVRLGATATRYDEVGAQLEGVSTTQQQVCSTLYSSPHQFRRTPL